jgi:hypothetical protein
MRKIAAAIPVNVECVYHFKARMRQVGWLSEIKFLVVARNSHHDLSFRRSIYCRKAAVNLYDDLEDQKHSVTG